MARNKLAVVEWQEIHDHLFRTLREEIQRGGLKGAQTRTVDRLKIKGLTAARINNYLQKQARDQWHQLRAELLESGGEERPTEEPTGTAWEKQLFKLVKRYRVQSVEELADRLNVAPRLVRAGLDRLHDRGAVLEVAKDQVAAPVDAQPVLETAPIEWGGKALTFCLVSDTHLGSRYEQLEPLNAVYDLVADRGIRDVFHSGDLVDGQKMYRGHEYEIHVHGADAQTEYAAEVYPKRPGVTTHLISGNHDWSFFKESGYDVVRAVAEARDDFIYYGPLGRMIDLKCEARRRGVFTLHLLHPDGGVAYALSYKLQKLAEGYAGGEKPDMTVAGHWHVDCSIFVRNIHMISIPCFQRQTPYLKRKGLHPVVGARFVRVDFSKDGAVGRVAQELVTWYVPEGSADKQEVA
jgi:hypothetical protein